MESGDLCSNAVIWYVTNDKVEKKRIREVSMRSEYGTLNREDSMLLFLCSVH